MSLFGGQQVFGSVIGDAVWVHTQLIMIESIARQTGLSMEEARERYERVRPARMDDEVSVESAFAIIADAVAL